ncbi:MAG: tRNA pseudouridine(13) synthase TruD [Thiothrix sp.]|nr:tRNA pseudouridine(13) synthase TruD [Thiothrix sp.]
MWVWPAAYAAPLQGILRTSPADFRVDEQMALAFTGTGEHLWLQVRKTGQNTEWVARQLARLAGIKPVDVGFAGLKDRQAVTTQWFSLYLPGRTDPVLDPLPEGVEILERVRHERKLKRGTLSANRFTLVLREVRGDVAQAEAIATSLREQGMPNYFGAQRFGHEQGNLSAAESWFAGKTRPPKRHLQGLYLSAARSLLFNQVLAERVRQGNWNTAIRGDVFMLDGTGSWFADEADATLSTRLAAMDIHPSGPLWGRGELPVREAALALEQARLQPFATLRQGLEQHGLRQERRSLRCRVDDLELEVLTADCLQLRFSLPPGSYATMVLAQLGDFLSLSSGSGD